MSIQALLVIAVICCAVHVQCFRLAKGSTYSRRSAISKSFTTSPKDICGAILEKFQGKMAPTISDGKVSKEQIQVLGGFLQEYVASCIEAKVPAQDIQELITTFAKNVQDAVEQPHKFSPYHTALRKPFDYYKWGNDFMRPLIKQEQSRLVGVEQLQIVQDLVAKGENVIFLSNHQTEADPQVVSIMLEQNGFGSLAEKMIFVAGHKVTTDPAAIPFSMGRNLLCIHSKKHIKNPPEDIGRKQAQNLDSMKALGDLSAQGGQVFWVAPSGGRDRADPETGQFVVAPFDSKVLDMFKLMAIQSQKPMHFFPMAMYTHQLIPPPSSVSSGVGEARSARRGAVSLHVLSETKGLGGLKDTEFKDELQQRVVGAFQELSKWHEQRALVATEKQ